MDNRYLYRGKRISDGKWVVGSYCYSQDFPITIFGEDEYGRHGINVDPTTIGQCSGKYDMSGKEVFEGDIIESHLGGQVLVTNMVIKYGTYQAYCPADRCYMDSVGFYASAQGYPDMPIGPLEDYAKVIGNIFDNSGLLNPHNCDECVEFDKEELRCKRLGYFVASNSEPCWDWYRERHEDCPYNPQN